MAIAIEAAATTMANDALYSELFWGAFGRSTAMANGTDLIFFMMQEFGGFDLTLAAVMAMLGASLGMSLNFGIGVLFSNLQKLGVSDHEAALYSTWQRRVGYVAPLFGLLSFLPLMAALIAICGFLRVRSWVVLSSVFVGQAAYYGYYLLQASS